MAKKQSRAGVKALIVVAAVGSTIGGWAYFASTATPASDRSTASLSASPSAAPSSALPTLVPIDDAIAASRAVEGRPQAQAPQPRAMRSVTIPQPPMAMSRSSR